MTDHPQAREIGKTIGAAGGRGLSFGQTFFLVLLVLKLIGEINWSWWWVTAPLWIPSAAIGAILLALGFVLLLIYILDTPGRRRRRAFRHYKRR